MCQVSYIYELNTIYFALIECSYDIVKQVAKDDLKWRVSKNEIFTSEWDVFFAELGVDSDMLS